MEALAKGDVVVFPFPYTDLSNRKLRPCLILSEQMGEDILLCQITSQKLRIDAHSVELRKGDTISGTLQIDSYIRANMIFTASAAQIQKRICKVKKETYSKVVESVIRMIEE